MQDEVAEGYYSPRVVSERQDKLILHDLILVNLEEAGSRVVPLNLLLQNQIALDILSLIDVLDCLDVVVLAVDGYLLR